MSGQDIVLEIPKVEKNTRSTSPPGTRHLTVSERMDFVEWFMQDYIQDLYKNKPRYKVRKMVMKLYLEEFNIKVSEPFLIGLDEGLLTRETIGEETTYCLARQFKKPDGTIETISLADYCRNPCVMLKHMQKLKR